MYNVIKEVMKMKKYSIELDENVAEFFEDVSRIVKRPVEEILADALFKQVEIICRAISEARKNDED